MNSRITLAMILVLIVTAAQDVPAQAQGTACSSSSSNWTACTGHKNGYDGDWRNNLYWGRGRLEYGEPSFAVYEGEFVAGMQHGGGTLFSASGEVVESGYWILGKFSGDRRPSAADYEAAEKASLLTAIPGTPGRSFGSAMPAVSIAIDSAPRVPAAGNSRVAQSGRAPLDDAKRECRDLGFTEKTEKYGSCVLELSRRAEEVRAVNPDPVDDADHPDAAVCQQYGYRRGSKGYADCRMQLDLAKRDYETRLRAYEDALKEYERLAAAEAARASRQRDRESANYNFCIAACNVRRGSNPMACMSECGGVSSSPVVSQALIPQPPPERSTYMINGQTIYCSARPQGAAVSVTCN